MPYRFTKTEKWQDKWFRNLTPIAKLLFLYICDNCDCAGFWEIDLPLAAIYIGCNEELIYPAWDEIKNRMVMRERFVWLPKFLKHQCNLPLQPHKPAHIGIIRALRSHPEFVDIANSIIENKKEFLWDTYGIAMPLSKGNGKGNGNGNGSTITNSKDKLIGDCGKTNLLDLDLEIARRRNKLASTIDQLLHPHGIEKQTFKHILSYLVQQVQTGRAELDIFDKVSQWAEQAAFSNVSNKKGLFVEKVKQETGFQGQKRLLKSCSS